MFLFAKNFPTFWFWYPPVAILGLILIGLCLWWSFVWFKRFNLNQGVKKKELTSFTLKQSTWRQTWTHWHFLIPVLLALLILFTIVIIGVFL